MPSLFLIQPLVSHLRPYNAHKLQFRSKQCVFLGYSNMHKGFKCLDPKEGRIYISHDVIFDEHMFPFANLHPNARARLRAELALLPDVLHNPSSSSFGVAWLYDQHLNSPNQTNALPSSDAPLLHVGEILETDAPSPAQTGATASAGAPYFVCSPRGNNASPRVIRLTWAPVDHTVKNWGRRNRHIRIPVGRQRLIRLLLLLDHLWLCRDPMCRSSLRTRLRRMDQSVP
jgi:hypothetical protein